MCAFSVPPGYRRKEPAARPKLDRFTGIIDQILANDPKMPVKQRCGFRHVPATHSDLIPATDSDRVPATHSDPVPATYSDRDPATLLVEVPVSDQG
jgi:hypothetical protein